MILFTSTTQLTPRLGLTCLIAYQSGLADTGSRQAPLEAPLLLFRFGELYFRGLRLPLFALGGHVIDIWCCETLTTAHHN
jgi:hypothetical protein